MKKQFIREQVLSERESLTPSELKENSRIVFEHFTQSSFYLECPSIFAYISFRNEISTRAIIDHALKKSKSVGVPSIQADGKLLPLVFLNWESLIPDKYYIPAPSEKKAFDFSEKTIILVPGIVFDHHGNRIGFGKGYYDRFLQNHPKALKVALAHNFQVKGSIPAEKHDIPVDIIITEKRIINCRGVQHEF